MIRNIGHHTNKNFPRAKIYGGQIPRLKYRRPLQSEAKLKKSAMFYLACIIGCLYQISQVSLQYFTYDTVTNLRMYRPKFLNPPSVSICFPYASLVNFTLAFRRQELKDYADKLSNDLNLTIDFTTYQMKHYNPNKFDRQYTAYIVEHFSVAQIMEMTNQIEDWINSCMVIDPQNFVPKVTKNLSDCLNVWSIDTYLKNDKKCFEISFKSRIADSDFIYSSERVILDLIFPNCIWGLRLNKTLIGANVEAVYIYLHPHYRKPCTGPDPAIFYDQPGRDHIASISYARSKSILLPKPYETDCKYYSNNRDQEINECIIKDSLEKYNRVPPATILPSDSQVKLFALNKARYNETLYEELQSLITRCCSFSHQRDCILEIYKPEVQFRNENGVGFQLELKMPSAPDLENRFIPHMTFLDYLIYSGSVLGIWFGLSVVQLPSIIFFTAQFRNILKNPKDAALNILTSQNKF